MLVNVVVVLSLTVLAQGAGATDSEADDLLAQQGALREGTSSQDLGAATSEGIAVEGSADARADNLRRHVHVLSTNWATLKLKALTPQPRASQHVSVRSDQDPRGCSFVGEVQPRGSPPATIGGTDGVWCDTVSTVEAGTVRKTKAYHPTPLRNVGNLQINQTSNGNMSTTDPVLDNCWVRCGAEDLMPQPPTDGVANRYTILQDTVTEAVTWFENTLQAQSSIDSLHYLGLQCGGFSVNGYYYKVEGMLIVTSRPTTSLQLYDVSTIPCDVDAATGRPSLVHINISPNLLDNRTATAMTVRKAVLQSLGGLNIPAMGTWLFPGTGFLYNTHDNVTYPTGPVRGDVTTNKTAETGAIVTFSDGSGAGSQRGSNNNSSNSSSSASSSLSTGATLELPKPPLVPGRRFSIVTPTLLQVAGTYFNCPSLAGVELEDLGYGDGLIHFEKRILQGELLTLESERPPSERRLVLSDFTLALLSDTGWYAPITTSAVLAATATFNAQIEMRWGKGLGCTFATYGCGTVGAWPTPTYLCKDFTQPPPPSCTFDRRATGQCNLRQLTSPVPEVYRVFSNTLDWGATDFYADRCPFVAAAPFGDSAGECTTYRATIGPVATSRGATYGGAARCFTSQVQRHVGGTATGSPTQGSTCYRATCSPSPTVAGKVDVHVKIGVQYVQCSAADTIVTGGITLALPKSQQGESSATGSLASIVESSTMSGTIQCGDFTAATLCGPLQLGSATPPSTATTSAGDDGNWAGYAPYWPTVTAIEPTSGFRNGGTVITLSGQYLTHCSHAKIAGQFVPLLYNFAKGNLRGRTRYFDTDHSPLVGGLSATSKGLGGVDVELWCNLSYVCPEGCGVSRLLKGFTLNPLTTCNYTVEGEVCRDQPACQWLEGRCLDREVTPAPTPAPPQTIAPEIPVDPGCFVSAPRYCPATGKCALSSDLCVSCGDSMIQCWNSVCVESFLQCECHPTTRVRCSGDSASGGRCAATLELCSSSCGAAYRCWNGLCAQDERGCQCPFSTPHRCNVTGMCVSQATDCSASTQCPRSTPFRCWDDTCVASVRTCRCAISTPYKCFDGICVKAWSDCRCPTETPVFCSDAGTCEPDHCPASSGSAATADSNKVKCLPGTVLCNDDTCVMKAEDCACSEETYKLPSVQLTTESQVNPFSTGSWLILPSMGYWIVCGVDEATRLTYQWSFAEILTSSSTATPVSVDVRAAVLNSPTLELPPNTLASNKKYLLTLTATAPNGQSSKATVQVFTKLPSREIQIAGGNRDIPSTSILQVEAQVSSSTPLNSDYIFWTCCMAAPDAVLPTCLQNYNAEQDIFEDAECPSILAAIANLHVFRPTIQSADGLPVGSYVLTATYNDTSASTNSGVSQASSLIKVKEGTELPTCLLEIQSSTADAFYSHQSVTITSSIQFSGQGRTTQKWAINGTVLSDATGGTMTLAPGRLQPNAVTTISTIVTTALDQVSTCRLLLVPRTPPEFGRCVMRAESQVHLQSSTGGLPVSGESRVILSAYGWGSDPELIYRFGYLTASGEQVLLSSTYSLTSQLYTIAPLLLGNPSLVTVRFFVQVSTTSSKSRASGGIGTHLVELRNTTCTGDLRSSARGTSITVLESLKAQLETSSNASNLPMAIDFGLRLASVLRDPNLGSVQRSQLAVQIPTAILRCFSIGEAVPTVAARSALIQATTASATSTITGKGFIFSATGREKLLATLVRCQPYLLTSATDSQQTQRKSMLNQLLFRILNPSDGLSVHVGRQRGEVRSLLAWSFSATDPTSTRNFLLYAEQSAVETLLGMVTTDTIDLSLSPGFGGRDKLSFTAVTRGELQANGGYRVIQADGGSGAGGGTLQVAGADGTTTTQENANRNLVRFPTQLTLDPASPGDEAKMLVIAFGHSLIPFAPSNPDLGLEPATIPRDWDVSQGAQIPEGLPPILAPGAPPRVSDLMWSSLRSDSSLRQLSTPTATTKPVVTEFDQAQTTFSPSLSSGFQIGPVLVPSSDGGVTMTFPILVSSLQPTGDLLDSMLQYNLTCYVWSPFEPAEGVRRWHKLGRAKMTAGNGGDVTNVIQASCGSSLGIPYAGFVGVFDDSWFPPMTPPPTPAPGTFSLSNLRNIAGALPTGAIVAITLACLVVVGALVGFIVRRKWLAHQKAKKEAEEKSKNAGKNGDGSRTGMENTNFQETSQILLVAQLLEDDPDLRANLELSRICAMYSKKI